jgi:hypothetical protein
LFEPNHPRVLDVEVVIDMGMDEGQTYDRGE